MTRITVVSAVDSISHQARAYAEYRMFVVVARHTRRVRRVRVVLRHAAGRGTCDDVSCSVTVALEPAGSLRIRGAGTHVSAAIDLAAARLGRAMARQATSASSYRRTS